MWEYYYYLVHFLYETNKEQQIKPVLFVIKLNKQNKMLAIEKTLQSGSADLLSIIFIQHNTKQQSDIFLATLRWIQFHFYVFVLHLDSLFKAIIIVKNFLWRYCNLLLLPLQKSTLAPKKWALNKVESLKNQQPHLCLLQGKPNPCLEASQWSFFHTD